MKSVSVEISVWVKIGKLTKIGTVMFFILRKKSVSVSVCYSLYRIGIDIGKVKSSKISQNQFKDNWSSPKIKWQNKWAF